MEKQGSRTGQMKMISLPRELNAFVLTKVSVYDERDRWLIHSSSFVSGLRSSSDHSVLRQRQSLLARVERTRHLNVLRSSQKSIPRFWILEIALYSQFMRY